MQSETGRTLIHTTDIDRREFVKSTVLAATGTMMAIAGTVKTNAEDKPALVQTPAASAAGAGLPSGKIGKLQISRLILGSNMITHCIHARDMWTFVNNLNKHYNTEAKILETLAIAEKNGINTIMTHADDRYLKLLQKYRDEMGGKLQWIVGIGTQDKETIRKFFERGIEAMYIFGHTCDKLCAEGNKDLLARTLDYIKMNDVPAGICGHDLNIVKFCEQNNVGADFYVKTFHHHHYPSAPRPDELKGPLSENPGYWCKDPVETTAVMKEVKKPWIAFKVMAAGVIPPVNAFKYAYENGSDFILAGMFDFEIEEDVKIARDILAGPLKRERPWLG